MEVFVMEGKGEGEKRALNEDGKTFVKENMQVFGVWTFKPNSQIYGGLFFVSSISLFFKQWDSYYVHTYLTLEIRIISTLVTKNSIKPIQYRPCELRYEVF